MNSWKNLLFAGLAATLSFSAGARAESAPASMDGFGRFAAPVAQYTTPAAGIRADARETARGKIGSNAGLTVGESADPAGGHALAYRAERWRHVDSLTHDTPPPGQRQAGRIAEIYGTSP